MADENGEGGERPSAVDRGALIRILDRFRTDNRIDQGYVTWNRGEPMLKVEFDLDYYPRNVEAAYLDIRWYRNDDFKIHYHETWEHETWDCRWDRHANSHNATDHFHPPPDAPRKGEDATYPDNLHEVIGAINRRISDRIESLWDAGNNP